MSFEKVSDNADWNTEILKMKGSFLQSWEWGEFQRLIGREVVRMKSDETLAQGIRMTLPLGKSYWYVPRGPIGGEIGDSFNDEIFTRVEPSSKPEKGVKVASMQPAQTMILNLEKDEEEILAGMHEKTRYNIRLAERKGVQIMPASSAGDGFDVFWNLVEETSERAGIKSHDKDYYRKMLISLSGDITTTTDKAVAKLFFAEHDGKALAAILLIRFGDTVTYLHGASSRDRRELMAPHMLHWHAIGEAKKWGAKHYDFWGVAPMEIRNEKLKMKNLKHSWAGITRFKKGFSGEYVEYPGTFDLPKNKFWYKVYSTFRKIRS